MTGHTAFDRASTVLGLAAVLSALFFFIQSGDLSLVRIASGAAVAVVLAMGALAVLGGWLRRPVLSVAAGVGFLLAAAVQLLQAGRDTNRFEGNGSTFSLWLGFGVGLLAIGLTALRTRPPEERGG